MDFHKKEFAAMDMFHAEWAIATAGTLDDFNACTIGWGSLGNIWSSTAAPTHGIVTIYVHPARYTSEFLKKNDFFTVSFFPKAQKRALGYMGAHSGRDEKDKAAKAGLTPVAMGKGIGYEEANLTFVCKKLYQYQFEVADLAPEIQEYYAGNPKVYPDGKGGWQPHIEFIGEVLDVVDKRWRSCVCVMSARAFERNLARRWKHGYRPYDRDRQGAFQRDAGQHPALAERP